MKKIYIVFILIIFFTSHSFASSSPESSSENHNNFAGAADKASAKIFTESCMNCHSGGVPRAPHSTTFSAMSADYILETLHGIMSSQASHLNENEKIKLAEFISGGSVSTNIPEPKFCSKDISEIIIELNDKNSYSQWGYDKENTRRATSDINSINAKNMKLKWVFAFPGATRSRSQPSVSGNVVFVGGQNSNLYALDRDTGCVRWKTKTQGEIRSAPVIEKIKNNHYIFAGDYEGNVYKYDAITGNNIWTKSLRYHPRVILTGSVRVYDEVIYVPLSSREWADGANPDYECCTFRGGVMALNANTGEELWTTYSIPVPAKHMGDFNESGKKILAPSGVPVWNSPTIDKKRRYMYVGTGENYSSPADDSSDAIIAYDIDNGDEVWRRQTLPGDAWNVACMFKDNPNCPVENGPDLDYSASSILIETDKGDILVSGQKSGNAFGINPDTGKIIWEKKIGKIDEKEEINDMTGTINYGGVALTGGDIIFSTGTPDNFVYGINAVNGDVLWSFEMDSAGSAPPILYEINGKQHVSIVSTGGIFEEYKSKGSSIYTFSIE